MVSAVFAFSLVERRACLKRRPPQRENNHQQRVNKARLISRFNLYPHLAWKNKFNIASPRRGRLLQGSDWLHRPAAGPSAMPPRTALPPSAVPLPSTAHLPPQTTASTAASASAAAQQDALSVILVTGGYDNTIRFWEAWSGVCSRTLNHQEHVSRLEGRSRVAGETGARLESARAAGRKSGARHSLSD